MTRASSDALVDVLVVGAGAAGMMAAIEAGRRGRRVRVVDHADRPGEKIRISGGGRCNFTNRDTTPAQFLSDNPHFCRSALSRYTPQDFIALRKAKAAEIVSTQTALALAGTESPEMLPALVANHAEDRGVEARLTKLLTTICGAIPVV